MDTQHLNKLDEQIVQKYFAENIRPLLSPQIIDRQHPFPFLKNKEQFVLTVLENKEKEKDKDKSKDKSQTKGDSLQLGIVPFSHLPPYFIFTLNQRRRVLFTADIILYCAQKLYGSRRWWKNTSCVLPAMRISRSTRDCTILTSTSAALWRKCSKKRRQAGCGPPAIFLDARRTGGQFPLQKV